MDKRRREQANPKVATRRSQTNKSKRYKNARIQTPLAATVIIPVETEEESHVPEPTTTTTAAAAAREKRTKNGNAPKESHAKPLSRLPVNYRNFAKPLSNKERANSTSVNKTKSNSARKRVDFYVKPGPKCSKQPPIDDGRVPIVLLNNTGGVSPDVDENNSLPPITEKPNENTLVDSTKIMEIEETSNRGGNHDDAGAQTETTAPPPVIPEEIVLTPDLMERNIRASSLIGGANSADRNQERRHIRLNLECTTVSGRRCRGVGFGSSSSSDDGTGEERNSAKKKKKWKRRRTYIRANAHTVHIHNHFYKE